MKKISGKWDRFLFPTNQKSNCEYIIIGCDIQEWLHMPRYEPYLSWRLQLGKFPSIFLKSCMLLIYALLSPRTENNCIEKSWAITAKWSIPTCNSTLVHHQRHNIHPFQSQAFWHYLQLNVRKYCPIGNETFICRIFFLTNASLITGIWSVSYRHRQTPSSSTKCRKKFVQLQMKNFICHISLTNAHLISNPLGFK